MKRLGWMLTSCLFVVLLGACGPAATVERNVLPTLVAITVPSSMDDQVVLQGRYLGDGSAGQANNSYVIIGADISGKGGLRVRPENWSATRIEFLAPEGAGSGFVFVVVDGVRSNGLPASLP
ncbi:MAG: hypothetical protein JSV66_11665 [Trueperaceae bacterium]|nr:MAG: hypothetical protein JSV66_11665 [Trueperaceae bacterium]